MRILFISNFYSLKNSSAAIRNNSLVKGLVECGHKVDVLTVKHSENSTSDVLNYGNVFYTNLFNLNLRKNVGKIVSNSPFRFIIIWLYEKVSRYVCFPDTYYKWPTRVNYDLLSNHDLIISSSDGKISHFVGLGFKKKYPKIPWIQIWGDPWVNDLNSNYLDKVRIKYYEKKLLKSADKIVYISQPTCRLIKNKFPSLSYKIFFVPRSFLNGVHIKRRYVNNEIRIVYTGAIFSVYGRNVTPLLEAVNEFNLFSGNGMKCCLDFYGEFDKKSRDNINKYSFSKVHNSVDVTELSDVYERSDILLFISNKASSSQIPGKLYDYLGTNLPILCLVNDTNTEVSMFLKKLGEKCVVINNDNGKIFEFLKNDLGKVLSKEYYINENFAPVFIAKKILNLL